MCKESVSITVGTDEASLLRGADLLRRMAGGGVKQSVTGGPIDVVLHEELSPEDEDLAMDRRIDGMVAAAAPDADNEVHPLGLPELDIDSRPWDARIDSGAKSKTADGRWKLRRGVDPTLAASVKAEIRCTTLPVEAAVVAPVALPVEAAVVAPVALPVEAAVVAPVALPAASVTTYPELIKLITDRGKLLGPRDVLDSIAASGAHGVGVTKLLDLAPQEHLCWIPLVAVELERIWATRA